jgi:hypothetical protein
MEGTIILSIFGLIKDSIIDLIKTFKLHSKVLWQDREREGSVLFPTQYQQHSLRRNKLYSCESREMRFVG